MAGCSENPLPPSKMVINMSAYDEYVLIQDFKRSGSAIIDRINYANVIAQYLYDTSLFGWLKKVAFSLFFSTHITVVDSNSRKILLYYSCRHKKRLDYDHIFSEIKESLNDHCDHVESKECFSVIQPWHTVRELKTAFSATIGYNKKTIHRIGAALLIAKYISTSKHKLESLVKKRESLITFCDAPASENILAQLAKSRGVTTYTAQHGQYRLLDKSNIGPDAEAYANFVSDYLLCWGEATRQEYIRFGFKPEQLITVGWIKNWSNSRFQYLDGVFGVMLNSETSKDSNYELLRLARTIADHLNLNYIVRLHPSSSPRQYKLYLGNQCIDCNHYNLEDYLNRVGFSIAHMTGAVIEMLHYKSPVYLYDDGKLAKVFRVEGLSYSSFDSMIDAIVNDRKNIDIAQKRISSLDKWYNDDSNQKIRIRDAIIKNKII